MGLTCTSCTLEVDVIVSVRLSSQHHKFTITQSIKLVKYILSSISDPYNFKLQKPSPKLAFLTLN